MGRKPYYKKTAKTEAVEGKDFKKKEFSNKRKQPGAYRTKLEKGSNDPAWYAASNELLRDSASIPYSWPVGTPIDFHNPLNLTASTRKWSVPGIQSIQLVPSVGLSDSPSSPINVASNATYAFVRHANSGHSNYDAPDLMLYIMSMSQIYSYICYLQRIYGVATLYAQTNRYLPDALLTAMGCNPRAIRSALSDFRYGINVLINKAASFAVPAEMTVFNRQAFLYSNIYTEGTSIKDQLYMYNPNGFWQYSWDTTTQKGKLTLKGLPSFLMSTQDLLDYGNNLLDPLIYDEDINIMSGDILKAYSTDKILKLAPLPTEYPILPLYNKEVLEQMQNATAVLQEWETSSNYVTCNIEQDSTNGWLVSIPKATVESKTATPDWKDNARMQALKTLTSDKIISTDTADVTPDITMENTRLVLGATGWTQVSPTKATINLICGSEIPVQVKYWYNRVTTSAQGLDEISITPAVSAYPWMVAVDTDVVSNIGKLCMSGVFKYRTSQMLNVFKQDGATVNPTFLEANLYSVVDNYAVISNDDLQKLHSAALMNELHVPFIGKI